MHSRDRAPEKGPCTQGAVISTLLLPGEVLIWQGVDMFPPPSLEKGGSSEPTALAGAQEPTHLELELGAGPVW